MALLDLYNLGHGGVNVDTDEIHISDDELRQAQNAINDPLGAAQGLRNRPGLTRFNTNDAAGRVLGGIAVPLPGDDESPNPGEVAEERLYVGFGPF